MQSNSNSSGGFLRGWAYFWGLIMGLSYFLMGTFYSYCSIVLLCINVCVISVLPVGYKLYTHRLMSLWLLV